jgi:hypothetical protein
MVFVPEIKVAFSGLDPSSLFRPPFRLQGTADARFRCSKSEFIPQKTAISSKYKPGFSIRWSHRASSITGVMLRDRPPLLGGALTLPNILILEEILEIVLLLQPAACAISVIDSSPLDHIMDKLMLGRSLIWGHLWLDHL